MMNNAIYDDPEKQPALIQAGFLLGLNDAAEFLGIDKTSMTKFVQRAGGVTHYQPSNGGRPRVLLEKTWLDKIAAVKPIRDELHCSWEKAIRLYEEGGYTPEEEIDFSEFVVLKQRVPSEMDIKAHKKALDNLTEACGSRELVVAMFKKAEERAGYEYPNEYAEL